MQAVNGSLWTKMSKMELSERAGSYLSSLEREDPTPIDVVYQLFEDYGVAPVDSWMDFHERYAGYVEHSGESIAIWGLCSETSNRLRPPRTLVCGNDAGELRKGQGEPEWIQCADVAEPVVYELYRDGEFDGYPCESRSFEVKIERTAIQHLFYREGTVPVFRIDGVSVSRMRAELEAEMSEAIVREASDQYAIYYLTKHRLMIVTEFGVKLSERR